MQKPNWQLGKEISWTAGTASGQCRPSSLFTAITLSVSFKRTIPIGDSISQNLPQRCYIFIGHIGLIKADIQTNRLGYLFLDPATVCTLKAVKVL